MATNDISRASDHGTRNIERKQRVDESTSATIIAIDDYGVGELTLADDGHESYHIIMIGLSQRQTYTKEAQTKFWGEDLREARKQVQP